jgi:hypothetical protein
MVAAKMCHDEEKGGEKQKRLVVEKESTREISTNHRKSLGRFTLTLQPITNTTCTHANGHC